MSEKAARLPDFLSHILEAIHRIQRYALGQSREAFMADEQLQDAIVRNIEIIGDASRNIATHAPTFVERHADIPWAALYAMRNRITHGYWTVDLDVVWNVVQRDLPILETQIQALKPAGDRNDKPRPFRAGIFRRAGSGSRYIFQRLNRSAACAAGEIAWGPQSVLRLGDRPESFDVRESLFQPSA